MWNPSRILLLKNPPRFQLESGKLVKIFVMKTHSANSFNIKKLNPMRDFKALAALSLLIVIIVFGNW